MTYRVGVKTARDPDWVFNGLVFATEQEADSYRVDLFGMWSALVDATVLETTAPANVRWVDGKLEFIDHPDIHITLEDEGHDI